MECKNVIYSPPLISSSRSLSSAFTQLGLPYLDQVGQISHKIFKNQEKDVLEYGFCVDESFNNNDKKLNHAKIYIAYCRMIT